jgi:hypothetical protein
MFKGLWVTHATLTKYFCYFCFKTHDCYILRCLHVFLCTIWWILIV